MSVRAHLILFLLLTASHAALTPNPEIMILLEHAEKAPDMAAIVTIEQQIIVLLVAAGLAWTGQRIHHKHVGIHKCNRHGFGVSWSRFHRLGAKIWRLGFSWGAASQVICFEDDDDKSNATFTVERQAAAEGYGKQLVHEIKYGAVGGNHLNQLNVAIDSGVPTGFACLADDKGNMCKAKIDARDPFWKDALEHGLKNWTVIHKDVAKLYPTLPNLIQRARNAVSQNASGESVIEMLLEIMAIASEMEAKTGAAPNWGTLQNIVLQSEPPFAEHIPVMCNWVIKYGQHSLNTLCEFVTVCVPSDREISPQILGAVTKWPTEVTGKQNSLLPELALAVLMAEYNCPADKVDNGMCNMMKPSKVATLANQKKELMGPANDLLLQFKGWIENLHLDTKWKTAYVGKGYCLVARMLLETSVPEELQGAALESGLHKIAEEVLGLHTSCFSTAKPSDADNPWEDFAPDSQPSAADSSQPAPGAKMISYNEGSAEGLEKRVLVARGFRPTVRVAVVEGKANAGAIFVIKQIDDDGTVKMKAIDAHGNETAAPMIKAKYGIFIEKYGLAASSVQVFLKYPENDIADGELLTLVSLEGALMQSMCQVYESFRSPNVKVLDKPHKAVISGAMFASGKLVIPVFGKILRSSEADGVPERTFEIQGHGAAGYCFYIKTQMSDKDGISPGSYVQYTKNEDEATTHVVWRPVVSKGGRAGKRDLRMPLIVNTSRVEIGTELKLYIPEKKKESTKKSMSIDCGVANKKAKTT